MLIPYRPFKLPRNEHGGVRVEKVVIGPTPHLDPTLASLRHFLISQLCPDTRIEHCGIPLRDA